MQRALYAALLVALCFVFISPAEARHRVKHYRVVTHATQVNSGYQQAPYWQPMGNTYYGTQPVERYRGHVTRTAKVKRSRVVDANGSQATYVGAGPTYRPPGAHHAWCGDGTSIAVFGRMVPGLALASNWRRFPPAAPGPGMVAVRNHHVKLITGGGHGGYTCYDPNSGGGVAHNGPCSLAGYSIHNPHAGSVAYAARGATQTYHARSRVRYASADSSLNYTYIAH